MKDKQFEELVKKLEKSAETGFAFYKFRLFLLAILGYLYIFSVLIILAAVAAFIVILLASGKGHAFAAVFKILIPLVVLIYVILKSLWVKFDRPSGIYINRQQYPRLFKTIALIRKRLKGPRIHHVLINDQYNAAIMQMPLLGIFGWQRNYLILGYPLLETVSPRQLVSVVAHEYGHLSGSHGKFSAWIYRIRKTWFTLMESLSNEAKKGKSIFQKFFNWYAPYFGAYSFVLARMNEYEADRCSADICGSRVVAETLTSIEINSAFYESDYWPGIYRQADSRPDPDLWPYRHIKNSLHTYLKDCDPEKILLHALSVETEAADTHPSLKDRLKAIGAAAHFPEAKYRTSAEFFLGSNRKEYADIFSRNWKNSVRDNWNERYREVKKKKDSLAKLAAIYSEGRLNEDEFSDYCLLNEELDTQHDPLKLYEEMLEVHTDSVFALYHIGRIYLERKDEKGIDFIERAVALEPGITLEGCQLAFSFYEDENPERAAEYEKRYKDRARYEDDVDKERNSLSDSDNFTAHQLDEGALEQVIDHLAGFNEIDRAFLACKITTVSDEPLYVLCVIPVKKMNNEDALVFSQELAAASEFPGEIFYVVKSKNTAEICKKAEAVSGSPFYIRG